jgi:hypothetical protein
MRALLACVVLGLLLAGCSTYHADDGGDPRRIDWDLSRSHTMDDVHWPRSEPVIDKADLRPVRSLRIRFPDGRRLTESAGINHVELFRDARQVTEIAIHSQPMTLRAAYRLALRWSREWGLATTEIERWRASGGREFNLGAYDPKADLDPARPSPSVEILHSFEDDPPNVVALSFYWQT